MYTSISNTHQYAQPFYLTTREFTIVLHLLSPIVLSKVRFAIEFEKTYIRWPYEALHEIEDQEMQPPLHGNVASPK